MSPPNQIIASTTTTDAVVADLRKQNAAQLEMMTKMMATVTEKSDERNLDRRHVPNTERDTRERKPNPKAHLCKNCNKMVMHKDELCWELESNKDTCPAGWPFK